MSTRHWIVLVVAASVAGCGTARKTEEAEQPVTQCTGCHGDPANGNAAPPRSIHGARDPSDVAVGAHQSHLQPSLIRQPIACSECHVVPQHESDPGHIDNPTASLTWGPLASARGVIPMPAPGPVPAGAAITCTNWCHGGGFASGNGTVHNPVWNKVDGSQAGCGTCHGIPPPPPHPAAANQTVCANCHANTVDANGQILVAEGKHINGVIDIAGAGAGSVDCTACHGDPTRADVALAPAPPRGTDGATDPSAPTVGAHQAHLNPGKYATAFACSECHVYPANIDHASQPLQMTFGAIATAYGSAASFDPTALTCTVYCHGNTAWGGSLHAPVWNKGSTQAACGTCHGIPSSGGKHLIPQHASIIDSCATCHPIYTQDLAVHVNGVKDVIVGTAITSWTPSTGTTPGSCTASCHATPTQVRTW